MDGHDVKTILILALVVLAILCETKYLWAWPS